MKKVVLRDIEYEIIRNDQNCFNKELVEEKLTDYFDPYDYIFGDFAYEKVRLKGFYEADYKKVKDINNIKNLDAYIRDYCNYGSKTFLLKKIK